MHVRLMPAIVRDHSAVAFGARVDDAEDLGMVVASAFADRAHRTTNIMKYRDSDAGCFLHPTPVRELWRRRERRTGFDRDVRVRNEWNGSGIAMVALAVHPHA